MCSSQRFIDPAGTVPISLSSETPKSYAKCLPAAMDSNELSEFNVISYLFLVPGEHGGMSPGEELVGVGGTLRREVTERFHTKPN